MDEKFQKMNVILDEYRKVIFENFNDGSDEDQSKAFKESAQIGDKVTKISIKIHRYKAQCNS